MVCKLLGAGKVLITDALSNEKKKNILVLTGKKITEVADVVCEFFEVAVHNILYVRKLYPETIFKPKRKYGVVVYQSVHPDVNDYIVKCLAAINFHLKKSKLKQIVLCFVTTERTYERFVFDVVNLVNHIDNDPFLINLEQSLRDFCVKLHTSGTYLDDLPEDATFKIQLLTTEASSVEFNQNSSFEDFQWIHVSNREGSIESADIVPLHTIEVGYLTLQVFVEKANPD